MDRITQAFMKVESIVELFLPELELAKTCMTRDMVHDQTVFTCWHVVFADKNQWLSKGLH